MLLNSQIIILQQIGEYIKNNIKKVDVKIQNNIVLLEARGFTRQKILEILKKEAGKPKTQKDGDIT